jgi:hypothetical protein
MYDNLFLRKSMSEFSFMKERKKKKKERKERNKMNPYNYISSVPFPSLSQD